MFVCAVGKNRAFVKILKILGHMAAASSTGLHFLGQVKEEKGKYGPRTKLAKLLQRNV